MRRTNMHGDAWRKHPKAEQCCQRSLRCGTGLREFESVGVGSLGSVCAISRDCSHYRRNNYTEERRRHLSTVQLGGASLVRPSSSTLLGKNVTALEVTSRVTKRARQIIASHESGCRTVLTRVTVTAAKIYASSIWVVLLDLTVS